MNEIVNTFLLAKGKFMSGMHLKQPGFMYSALQTTKKKKGLKNLKKQGSQDIFI